MGYKTGSITIEFKTETPSYDHGIKLLADVKRIVRGLVAYAYRWRCFIEVTNHDAANFHFS